MNDKVGIDFVRVFYLVIDAGKRREAAQLVFDQNIEVRRRVRACIEFAQKLLQNSYVGEVFKRKYTQVKVGIEVADLMRGERVIQKGNLCACFARIQCTLFYLWRCGNFSYIAYVELRKGCECFGRIGCCLALFERFGVSDNLFSLRGRHLGFYMLKRGFFVFGCAILADEFDLRRVRAFAYDFV